MYFKKIGTVALFQFLSSQCQAVTVSYEQTDAVLDDDYYYEDYPPHYPMDMPDTMINFNAPVVINIYNGDNCDDGCSEPDDPVVDPTVCDFQEFDNDDEIGNFVDYMYSQECQRVMDMRRDNPTDEDLKASLYEEEGIDDPCLQDYLVGHFNEVFALCEGDIMAQNEDLYNMYVLNESDPQSTVENTFRILGSWYFGEDEFDWDEGSGYDDGSNYDDGDDADDEYNFGEFWSQTCNYGELRCKAFDNGFDATDLYGVGFMNGFDMGYMYGGCDYVDYKDEIGEVGNSEWCDYSTYEVRCLGFWETQGFSIDNDKGMGFMMGFDHAYQYGDCAEGVTDEEREQLDENLLRDDFIIFLWSKIKENHCTEFGQAMIGVLSDQEWEWEDMAEFTFDPEEHTFHSADAAKDAWYTCFPDWTGEDITGDGVVDEEDVMRMLGDDMLMPM